MSRVSVVVVTYNAREWVPRCLDSVRRHQTVHELELIVFDNHSTQFAGEELREWAGHGARVHVSQENLGFGRGCNQAVSLATGHYVLLLNPDAVLQPGCVDALVNLHQSDQRIGITGGRVLAPDGTLDRGSCWGHQTLWSLTCFAFGVSALLPRSAVFNPEGLGEWARNSTRRVGIVTGCLLLIDRDLWNRLGGFDERFFMYGEDADLCQRAARLGSESWITPDAQAIHALGASSGTTARKQLLLFRGKVTLIQKGEHGWRRGLGRLLLGAGVLLRATGATVLGRDRGAWRELWRHRSEWHHGWVSQPVVRA